MKTLDAYLIEVRDLHRQAVEMFKDVKENHLAHIEPDIQSLKKDISSLKTDVSLLKDTIQSIERNTNVLIRHHKIKDLELRN